MARVKARRPGRAWPVLPATVRGAISRTAGPMFGVPLYSNAFYLMATSAWASLSGFAFWVVVARFYTADVVGTASATLAAMGLLSGISGLGLGYGLIKFLPSAGASSRRLLNSSFTSVIITAIVVSLVFLAGLGLWSSALMYLRETAAAAAAFVVFTVAFSLRNVTTEAIIAGRQTVVLLLRQVIFDLLRIPFAIWWAGSQSASGIFGSWGVALWVALLFTMFVFIPRVHDGYRFRLSVHSEARKMIRFSFANYLANLFRISPSLLFPILVIGLLGSESSAYFYVAWMMAGTVGAISESVSMSLFAEGANEESQFGRDIRRSLKMIFLIQVPVVIAVLAFADTLLLVFGAPYSKNAVEVLRILAIGTLPAAINATSLSIMRVRGKTSMLLAVTFFGAALALGLCPVLLPRFGIVGAGIAWLVSQGTVSSVLVAAYLVFGRPGMTAHHDDDGESAGH